MKYDQKLPCYKEKQPNITLDYFPHDFLLSQKKKKKISIKISYLNFNDKISFLFYSFNQCSNDYLL